MLKKPNQIDIIQIKLKLGKAKISTHPIFKRHLLGNAGVSNISREKRLTGAGWSRVHCAPQGDRGLLKIQPRVI